MRILIANKFYYSRGGDCIYSMELARILEAAGHAVAFFAMDFPQNEPSPWQSYFPSEVAFSPRKPWQMLKGLVRPFYAPEVIQKFKRLLDDFKPDVVHLNNIHTQLSPVIAQVAKERGIRVVWTLHDYKLLCPRYDCLRNGKPCELCFGGDKSFALRYSCMKGSRLASAIAFIEAKKWNRAKLEACTDVFICPSQFMKSKMESGGFAPDKLYVLKHFMDSKKMVATPPATSKDHYCYVGRLSPEKGVKTLLEVASQLPYPLKIIGTGPLEQDFRRQFQSFSHIEFLGHRNWSDIQTVLTQSRFLVAPSECYEVLGLSAMEALMMGVPVLGANIGGIPELVTPGKTGELFESGSAEDLRRHFEALWTNPLRPDATAHAEAFSASRYLERLIKLYENHLA